MAHRKWKETKQLTGTAGPGNMLGCCLIYIHFLWGKLSTRTVLKILKIVGFFGPPEDGRHMCMPPIRRRRRRRRQLWRGSNGPSAAVRSPPSRRWRSSSSRNLWPVSRLRHFGNRSGEFCKLIASNYAGQMRCSHMMCRHLAPSKRASLE